MDESCQPPKILRAAGEYLFDQSGRAILDLFSANGTAWLGHCHPTVRDALAGQLDRVWTTGALVTTAVERACERLEAWFPPTHGVAGFYCTGTEAGEFAYRVARVATGRSGAVGFERSMHGKSLAMSSLAWENPAAAAIEGWVRLPFTSQAREADILQRLETTLQTASVAAVFIEPWQATGGGYSASIEFFEELGRLCRSYRCLLIFDELLTGLYRTGVPFYFSRLSYVPDVVLVGKALGSGFPVSAVVLNREIPVVPPMLPGSTYANNSLAAAAVSATLDALAELDLRSLVERIEYAMRSQLIPLTERGCAVRGIGALWVVEVPGSVELASAVEAIYKRGVAVGCAANYLRLLPAVIMEPDRLAAGCRVVVEELSAAVERAPSRSKK